MQNLNVEIVPNRDHIGVIERLLQGDPSRVRIYALNVRDVKLASAKLGSRLSRLLASGRCTVTIVYGGTLLKKDKRRAKDKGCREALEFLHRLEGLGARVYWNRKLHAKVLYVEDRMPQGGNSTRALISSANFTKSALTWSHELGVAFDHLDSRPCVKHRIEQFTNGVLVGKRPLEQEEV